MSLFLCWGWFRGGAEGVRFFNLSEWKVGGEEGTGGRGVDDVLHVRIFGLRTRRRSLPWVAEDAWNTVNVH